MNGKCKIVRTKSGREPLYGVRCGDKVVFSDIPKKDAKAVAKAFNAKIAIEI